MALKIKNKRTRSILVVRDEEARYCYLEIPIQAFMFDDHIDFEYEDRNADMLGEMCDNAKLNQN